MKQVKKYLPYIILVFCMFFIANTNVSANTERLSENMMVLSECNGILMNGSSLNNTGKIFQSLFDFVRYALVIATLALGIFDFFKAITSQDKDGYKKAAKNFVLRLVLVVILFFAPIIINFVLSAFGISNPLCGIK